MAYTNVQFIGYVIDTAPQNNPDGTHTYLGLGNPQLDIEARCALMLRAMHTARDALREPLSPPSSPPSASSTLTVFVAPEFFFRGATGAYAMDDVQLAIATLQRMAADDGWLDWVFVFGTIVGSALPPSASPPAGTALPPGSEVYNFSLVQQGGVAFAGDAGARAVMKELLSNIDFIASQAHPGGLLLGEVEYLAPAQPGGPGRERQRLHYDGAGIFELAGITWALEVCLDHGLGRLQQSPQLPGEQEVQLQIVPSCGMDVQGPHIIAQQGGYVFNCDGLGAARHSTLQQSEFPPVNILSTRSAPVGDAPLALPSTSPVQDVPVKDLYASGPGVVTLYPPSALPAPRQVPGSAVPLEWPASADYQFLFQIIYDASGQFTALECEIRSTKTNFHAHRYILPMELETRDTAQQPVRICMRLAPSSSGYHGAVWCKIHVPGFIFEGNAFEFSARADGPAPFTIW